MTTIFVDTMTSACLFGQSLFIPSQGTLFHRADIEQ